MPTVPGQASVIAGVLGTATAQLGKPYVYGSTGPNSFDCSGFTQFCYQQGAGIAIGRDTTAQWRTGSLVYDASGSNPPPISQALANILPGDLIFWGAPGASGPRAHVQMCYAANQIIEAPYTGSDVHISNIDLVGGAGGDPLQGIRRYIGGDGKPLNAQSVDPNAAAGGTGGGAPAKSGAAAATQDFVNANKNVVFSDPADNRPFSPYFFGQVPPYSRPGAAGGFRFSALTGPNYPTLRLVRGGMVQLQDSNPPKGFGGKPFACFFMVNPNAISQSYTFNNDVAPPSTLSSDLAAITSLAMMNQSVSFELIFNRMFEVWQGDFGGPSEIGVRWDVRALERLAGLYDTHAGESRSGISKWGPGNHAPIGQPVQVVFGGENSFQFQGLIQGLDVNYTRFDGNMVPIEATVNVQLLQIYAPPAGDDLSSSVVQPQLSPIGSYAPTVGAVGPYTVPDMSTLTGSGPGGLTQIGKPQ
jgi:hypothetical protein